MISTTSSPRPATHRAVEIDTASASEEIMRAPIGRLLMMQTRALAFTRPSASAGVIFCRKVTRAIFMIGLPYPIQNCPDNRQIHDHPGKIAAAVRIDPTAIHATPIPTQAPS